MDFTFVSIHGEELIDPEEIKLCTSPTASPISDIIHSTQHPAYKSIADIITTSSNSRQLETVLSGLPNYMIPLFTILKDVD